MLGVSPSVGARCDGNVCSSFIVGHLASTVTRARKHSVKLAAAHFFDELTRPSPHLGLDRIKPVAEKINSHLGCKLRRIRLPRARQVRNFEELLAKFGDGMKG
jgi:hypothetical protein